jgi:hypothetical protein
MKTRAWLLLAVITMSAALPYMYAYHASSAAGGDEFYFGVTYRFNTTEEAKLLIDKVKDYTDLFVIDSWDITTNETLLNGVCDYAAEAGLKFIVYFDLISRTTYSWHQDWLQAAKTRWGGKFLGIYLHDELGGKQLDGKINGTQTFQNASNYNDAADKFVNIISSFYSTHFAKNNSIPLFTSDYVLSWFDYLAGYDTVFVELGFDLNTTQQIAMCRGAANMQGKDWGAIILWKTYEPPYLGSGQEMLDEMVAAYRAGAKYVIVFNHPRYPETTPYGVLGEEHFAAMKEFHDYVKAYPRNVYGRFEGRVAFVLPKDYGWGARRLDDSIWGLWPADEKAPLIWENMNKLIARYGFELDIVFDDARFNPNGKYSETYAWNASIT